MKVRQILLTFFIFAVVSIFSEIALGNNRNSKDNDEVSSNVPKDYGVEINPIYLLMSKRDNILLSGAVSVFNISRKAELAIPISYYNTTDEDYKELKNQTMIIDFQYRRFLKGIQSGFYFSGGLRYSYNEGYDYNLWWDEDIERDFVRHKIGIDFGIGYRYFSKSGLYWGFSIYGGRYFTGTDVEFYNSQALSTSKDIFWDIELLKFGYSF